MIPIAPILALSAHDLSPDDALQRLTQRWRAVRSISGVVQKSFFPNPPDLPWRFEFTVEKTGRFRFVSRDVRTFFDGTTYFYVNTPNNLYYKILRTDPGMAAFVRKPSLRAPYALFGFETPVPQRPAHVAYGSWKGRKAIVASFKGDRSFGATQLTAYYEPNDLLPLGVVEGDALAKITYEYSHLKFNTPSPAREFAWSPPPNFRQSRYEVEALLPLNSPAPRLTVKDPFGAPLSLAEAFKSHKLTVVDFWFYHCPPCMEAFPKLKALYESGKSSGLGFVAVNWSDSSSLVREFLKEKQLDFPVAMSGEGAGDDIVKSYKVTAFPTTYLVDQNGKVIARWVGIDEPKNFSDLQDRLKAGGIQLETKE